LKTNLEQCGTQVSLSTFSVKAFFRQFLSEDEKEKSKEKINQKLISKNNKKLTQRIQEDFLK
jgi:hypothetical protein